MPKRIIRGKIVKKSGDKTASLLVERKVMHPKYHKIVKRSKKYLVHDEKNEITVGDFVAAIECPPVSKTKFFRLHSIIAAGSLNDKEEIAEQSEIKASGEEQ